MNNETIKALFDEDFLGCASNRPTNDEYSALSKKSSDTYDSLISQLDETAQHTLEHYLDLHGEIVRITRMQNFSDGFSIAIRLLVEAICNSNS